MKTRIFFLILILGAGLISCSKDFLEKPPLDQLSDETFWVSEKNVRTFSYGFYTDYFKGYGSGNTWGNFFSGQSLNDDFAPGTPSAYIKDVPATNGGWGYSYVRKANLFLQKIQDMPVSQNMTEEAKKHWSGIARFFRAMEYCDLVQRFGDVTWYDQVISEKDTAQLYKPREDRAYIMDKVLEDFKYAAENVRVSDGVEKLTINKDIVLGFMSSKFLFEGTWQKYHKGSAAKAKEYLEASKWAANEVIQKGKYSLGKYREVFNSLDLSTNSEVLLFRQYEPKILTHSLMNYVDYEPQTGASKSLMDSYLADDGLPISLSTKYKGDKDVKEYFANRDGRMKETYPDSLRLNAPKMSTAYSTSGFVTYKFLNESFVNDRFNTTDAPILRFGEILVNYAEACAELATVGGEPISNSDLDKSINKLRKRINVNLPDLRVNGDQPIVNGQVYDDPKRDKSVPSLIWEIRRERRVELVFEGFRYDDLRRWKKLEYTDTEMNPEINMGAWIRKSDFDKSPKPLPTIVLNKDPKALEGYITPSWQPQTQRKFTNPRIYLYPLPTDQIVLYKQHSIELTQNPGW